MHADNSFGTRIDRRWVNLAQPRLGAEVLFASDDFFAPKERLIEPGDPVFIADKYDEHGKWMDGWESRRKRTEGYDYCIVRLGLPGILRFVDIDTAHFTGNYAPVASLDVCWSPREPDADTEWIEIVPSSPLQGDSHNGFEVRDSGIWTHVRLNIYPDGGVARLRVYGDVYCDWERHDATQLIDLIALENGGRVLECNDEHFGSRHNLVMPGRGLNMGDGWETRRRREPGHDWVLIKLGRAGEIEKIEVDTAHFKGNFPDAVSIDAANLPGDDDAHLAPRSLFWKTLLPRQPLQMDRQHYFESELAAIGTITHVRVNIYPDGGLSRVRLYGYVK